MRVLILTIGSFAVMLILASCDLRVITIEEPEEMIVAELVLRAGSRQQYAWLYRTGVGPDRTVPDATVIVHSGGDRFEFNKRDIGCVDPEAHANRNGTCYSVEHESGHPGIVPGSTYELEIVLPDGGRLSGTTTVPTRSFLIKPRINQCSIEPHTNFEIVWTQSATAWIYAAETELIGIRPPLQAMGIEVPRDPLPLFGLSAARNDTTIVFPKEFGLFNRIDPDLTDALVVLQGGLPPGVVGLTRIAAADRNYVNWVRGGNFNPSGTVRVPSIFGDGTGVFGSIVPEAVRIHSGDSRFPPC